ncbi:MAG: putative lipid II flippase FtsW [Elusimicrobia bacterium]|nr:putative lipid II flippase FtsW [Candidatus Liberimonas magnetica]
MKDKASYNFDYSLFIITLILVILGILMVFSSSVIMADIRWKAPYLFVIKQAVWAALGLIGMMLFSNFNYHYLQKYVKILMFITLAVLVAVLIIGTVKGGAKRWLRFGFIGFQPSELAKLVVVVALADYLDRKKSRIKDWRGLWPAFFMIGLFCIPIAMEPDLGTPVLMVIVSMNLLLVAGARFWHILVTGLAFIPFGVIEVLRKPYRIERMKSFFSSWYDINSGSYQLSQSILALGSGGFFGKGLGQGQLKMMYLPEPHTDFIFPIIGEELGYAGALFVIALFILFAWRGLVIARNSKDLFGGFLAVGITFMVVFQVAINLGVSCGLLPTKGLSLPFVSFGGSSLMINLISVGILLNISKKINSKS